PLDGAERELWRARMAHSANDPAVTAGRNVTTWPRVRFLHIARREDLLVENRHCADKIAPVLVRPDLRCDVVHRIDNIAIAIVADRPMRPLRGIADNRQRRIDQQIQPIDRFLDKWAALEPDAAEIFAAAHRLLNDISYA